MLGIASGFKIASMNPASSSVRVSQLYMMILLGCQPCESLGMYRKFLGWESGRFMEECFFS